MRSIKLRTSALDLLLGDSPKVASAVAGLDAQGCWQSVIETCSEWRVLPQLNRRLNQFGIELSAETRAPFKRMTSESFLRTSRCVERGAKALEHLYRAGILCAGFKGIATIATLYSGPGGRSVIDVDILIRQDDLGAALAELMRAGFVPAVSGTLDAYIEFVRNSPGFAGNEAVTLTDGSGGSIDLHWRLGQLNTGMLLEGAQEIQQWGRTIRVLRAAHCLTTAGHHALRNNFVPDEMIRDLLDFRDWLPWLERHGAVDEAIGTARQNHVWGAGLALVRLIEEFEPTPTASAFMKDSSPDELRVAQDLAELYRSQLKEGLLNSDLVYLADGASWRQIAKGAGTGWSRYRSYMREFEQTNGRDAIALGPRVWNLALAALRLPLSRWKQVRTLAAMKNAGLR